VGERATYPPGTFCWVELATSDAGDAARFYCSLFGWDARQPAADARAGHATLSLGGEVVCAIAPQPPRQREAGAPAMWNSYVSVASAEEALARARELGGIAHSDAFDVGEAGRMAVVQDPQGCFFELWEPRARHGASLVNAPGAPTWNELLSADPAAAAAFYTQLLGWSAAPFDGAPGPYTSIRNGEHSAAGIRPLAGAGAPPGWLVYFGSGDLDRDVRRAQQLGGELLEGPVQLSVGRIATLADPQGAAFALFDGDFDE
jgi:predicted enzyme related to lactoylglutathione lyase